MGGAKYSFSQRYMLFFDDYSLTPLVLEVSALRGLHPSKTTWTPSEASTTRRSTRWRRWWRQRTVCATWSARRAFYSATT